MRSIVNDLKAIFNDLKIDIDKIVNENNKVYIYLKNSYSYGHIYALGFRVVRKLSIKGVRAEFNRPIKFNTKDGVSLKIRDNDEDNGMEILIISG